MLCDREQDYNYDCFCFDPELYSAHHAVEYVRSSEQRGGAVAFVVVPAAKYVRGPLAETASTFIMTARHLSQNVAAEGARRALRTLRATSLEDPMSNSIPITGSVDTRIDGIEVRNGYPTDDAVARLFDEMDLSAPSKPTCGRCPTRRWVSSKACSVTSSARATSTTSTTSASQSAWSMPW